jgi:predicted transposase YdaD
MVSDFCETKIYQEAIEEGYEQGLKHAYKTAFKAGFDAGLGEAALMIARRMLVYEMSSKQIEEATGLSLAAINRLKKRGRRKNYVS